MGRNKNYDRNTLVGQALRLFHERGFGGTSTQELVAELGVNRNSMYAEFGSKQALFEAALERYDEVVVGKVFGQLEAPEASLDAIVSMFDAFELTASKASGLGCLMCNTAAELGGTEPGEHEVRRYFERIRLAFLNSLEGARRAGALVPIAHVDDEAALLTATVLGIFVMVRGRAPKALVRAAIRAGRRHVQSLRTDLMSGKNRCDA